MSRILSAEIFKIRKGKALPITILITAAFAVFYAAMTVLFVRFIIDLLPDDAMSDAIMMGFGMDDVFPSTGFAAIGTSFSLLYQTAAICAAVCAAVWICDEFDSGTVRNLLSVGKSRMQYYLSKLLVVLVVSIIFTLISTVLMTGIVTAFFGFGSVSASAPQMLMFFVGQVLLYFTYASLFVMIAFLLRHVGATLGITIGYVGFLESILAMILTLGFAEPVRFLQNILPFYNISQFTGVLQGRADTQDFLTAAAMCLITIALTTFVGMFTFAKRDVK